MTNLNRSRRMFRWVKQWILQSILGLMLFFSAVLYAANLVKPTSSPSPKSTSPVPSPSPSLSSGPKTNLISVPEGRQLRAEFLKAQRTEFRSLEHRLKLELEQFKAVEKAKKKTWDEAEKQKRRNFFDKNLHGAERRTYMKDLIARRKTYLDELAQARKLKNEEVALQIKNLHSQQDEKRMKFEESLGRNERPPVELWPGANP